MLGYSTFSCCLMLETCCACIERQSSPVVKSSPGSDAPPLESGAALTTRCGITCFRLPKRAKVKEKFRSRVSWVWLQIAVRDINLTVNEMLQSFPHDSYLHHWTHASEHLLHKTGKSRRRMLGMGHDSASHFLRGCRKDACKPRLHAHTFVYRCSPLPLGCVLAWLRACGWQKIVVKTPRIMAETSVHCMLSIKSACRQI